VKSSVFSASGILMAVSVCVRQWKTSVLPYLAPKRNGVAPFLLSLFKGAPHSTRAFVTSRLPVRAGK